MKSEEDDQMEARGLFRIENGWTCLTTQHSVIVHYPDGHKREVPEDEYRSGDYFPPFDALPWREASALKETEVRR
jgi:hypothetical protein